MVESTISDALLQAYRETHYRVEFETGIVVQIGVHNPALLSLYEKYKVCTAAFVSACNPFSQLLPDHRNQELHRELERVVVKGGWPALAAKGEHPSGSWPAEQALLVLGAKRQQAVALGHQFRQNAIVFVDKLNPPELVLLQ